MAPRRAFLCRNVLCLTDFKGPSEYTQPQQPTKAKPALFCEIAGRLFFPRCHVSCVLALQDRISLGCCMHHRKPTRAETLIERIYREETGHKMPNSIKRILFRKPTAKHKPR